MKISLDVEEVIITAGYRKCSVEIEVSAKDIVAASDINELLDEIGSDKCADYFDLSEI
jgi:hypothetical protein